MKRGPLIRCDNLRGWALHITFANSLKITSSIYPANPCLMILDPRKEGGNVSLKINKLINENTNNPNLSCPDRRGGRSANLTVIFPGRLIEELRRVQPSPNRDLAFVSAANQPRHPCPHHNCLSSVERQGHFRAHRFNAVIREGLPVVTGLPMLRRERTRVRCRSSDGLFITSPLTGVVLGPACHLGACYQFRTSAPPRPADGESEHLNFHKLPVTSMCAGWSLGGGPATRDLVDFRAMDFVHVCLSERGLCERGVLVGKGWVKPSSNYAY